MWESIIQSKSCKGRHMVSGNRTVLQKTSLYLKRDFGSNYRYSNIPALFMGIKPTPS